MKNIHIINGPNLNLLEKREPDIYGKQSFEIFFTQLQQSYKVKNIALTLFQSNYEGAIIENIHAQIDKDLIGLIINAGAYTHYSYAIADALRILSCPILEVHISNIYSRESFRHVSVLSSLVKGGIFGLGLEGYRLAVEYLLSQNL
ncbi:MAG: type II 3-dehydroquinate dehydratase [Bacteroidia bacterium]|nr:type II 3-dehydroquinate dehydratase [Bacteroidia bacterium]MDW8347973.1 type II 3-dehydroquinate dehydratase [Bacteroidia bacterium]